LTRFSFTCPKCGATMRERPQAPARGPLGGLLARIKLKFGRPPMGRLTLECEKCGHREAIIIN
jgi:predicted nucleic-acid-binding Zn-ribbon protein